MPETFTNNLGITLPADGENDGTWGAVVNENMEILDRAVNGSVALTLSGTTSSITTAEGDLSLGQYMLLVLGGSLSSSHTITIQPNDAQKIYIVRNTTSQSVVFTQGSGGNAVVAAGTSAIISSDGNGSGAIVSNITNSLGATSISIIGGTINGAVIGGTNPAAGTFTTATATTVNGTTVNATTTDTAAIEVTNLRARDGTAAGSIADTTGVVTLASSVLTTADINGGTIDGTAIGGSSASTGNFTTVDATTLEVTNLRARDGTSAGSIADSSGVVTLASSVLSTTDINGGTIDGATIGGSVRAPINGTTGNFNSALTVASASGAGVVNILPDGSTFTSQLRLHTNNGGSTYQQVSNNSGILTVGTRDTNPIYFETNSSQRMVIHNDGEISVGTLSLNNNPANGTTLTSPGSATRFNIGHVSGTLNGTGYIGFCFNAATIGSISQNGTTGVLYNTTSDYRLKENVQPMTGALEKVAQLNPVTYTWKADGSAGQGFIAHELQAVVPDAVTGKKDAVDADGSPQYQGIDASVLVATLCKAVQELKVEVDSLRAQLNP